MVATVAAIAMLGCVRRSPDLRGDMPMHLTAGDSETYRLLLAMVRASADVSPVRLCRIYPDPTLRLTYEDLRRLHTAVAADGFENADYRCTGDNATLRIDRILVRGDTVLGVARLSAAYQVPSACPGVGVSMTCSTPDSIRNRRWIGLQTCLRAERQTDGVWRVKERRSMPSRPMSTEDVLGCSLR